MKKNSAKNKTVNLLYKALGETPNDCILRFKRENPGYVDVSITYAGRLDPMAEGLLLVLSGEEIKNKDEYLGLNKTYECEVLWGFETDTLDVLGVVRGNFSSSNFSRSTHNLGAPNLLTLSSTASENLRSKHESQNFLQKFIGKFEQKYPAYSSKPVNGKPLWEWAREGKIDEVEIPSHEVELFDARFISRKIISKKDLLEGIQSKILKIFGDFRQKEILDKWREVLSKTKEKEFAIDKLALTVSSGFYVRQFVCDLAEKLNTSAVTFHIKRVKIGKYSAEDSI